MIEKKIAVFSQLTMAFVLSLFCLIAHSDDSLKIKTDRVQFHVNDKPYIASTSQNEGDIVAEIKSEHSQQDLPTSVQFSASTPIQGPEDQLQKVAIEVELMGGEKAKSDITITYNFGHILDGNIGEGQANSDDFSYYDSQLTISEGSDRASIIINISGDEFEEEDELLSIKLTSVQSADGSTINFGPRSQQDIVILNDDNVETPFRVETYKDFELKPGIYEVGGGPYEKIQLEIKKSLLPVSPYSNEQTPENELYLAAMKQKNAPLRLYQVSRMDDGSYYLSPIETGQSESTGVPYLAPKTFTDTKTDPEQIPALIIVPALTKEKDIASDKFVVKSFAKQEIGPKYFRDTQFTLTEDKSSTRQLEGRYVGIDNLEIEISRDDSIAENIPYLLFFDKTGVEGSSGRPDARFSADGLNSRGYGLMEENGGIYFAAPFVEQDLKIALKVDLVPTHYIILAFNQLIIVNLNEHRDFEILERK